MMDSKMKFILAPILLSEVIGVPNNSVFKAPQRCSSGYTYATTRNTFALTFLLLLTSYRPPRIRANKLFHLSLHLSMPDKTEPTLTSSENVPPFANIITFYSRATRTRRPTPPPPNFEPRIDFGGNGQSDIWRCHCLIAQRLHARLCMRAHRLLQMSHRHRLLIFIRKNEIQILQVGHNVVNNRSWSDCNKD